MGHINFGCYYPLMWDCVQCKSISCVWASQNLWLSATKELPCDFLSWLKTPSDPHSSTYIHLEGD